MSFGSIAVWEVLDDFHNGWQTYRPEFCCVLESAYSRRREKKHSLSDGRAFDFSDMVALDRTSGKQYPIHRLDLPGGCALAQGIWWMWYDDKEDNFKPYAAEVVNYIEEKYSQDQHKHLDLSKKFSDFRYTLDFLRKTQTNNETFFQRPIKRCKMQPKFPAALVRQVMSVFEQRYSAEKKFVPSLVSGLTKKQQSSSVDPLDCSTSNGDGTTNSKSSAGKLKNHRLGSGPVPSNLRRFVNALTEVPEDDCCICMAKLHEESGFAQTSAASSFCHAVQLNKCKHMFHTPCLKAAMDNDSSKAGLMCPYCKTIYGTKTGTQPHGRMTSRTTPIALPDYSCGTIEITYDIRSGTQGPEHPNPGRRYHAHGFPRSAYLPNNKDGKKILKMLEVAWERRLIFTVGRSVTSGANDVVTWNEIHHKTSKTRYGSHCYPDPNYFTNITEELKAQGVTEADIK